MGKRVYLILSVFMEILSKYDIEARRQSLSGWALDGNEIKKNYEFKDFVAAMSFVNNVAGLSERMDHHPDIFIRYNKVILTLSTHSAGGLTEKDFELAHKIEELVAGGIF